MYNYQDKLEPISHNSSLYEFFTETNTDLDIQNELDTVEDDLHRNNINTQNYEYNDIILDEQNEQNEQNDENDEESDLPAGCCGLTNMGNTCYMNACIQALSNIEDLVSLVTTKSIQNKKLLIENYFKNNNPKSTEDFTTYINKKCFVTSLEKTFETLWANQYESITPTSIRNATINNFPEFNNNQQQDAEEYLLGIINKLDDELQYSKMEININNAKYKQMYYNYIKLTSDHKKKIYW